MAKQAAIKQEDALDDQDPGLDNDAEHDSSSGPPTPGADDASTSHGKSAVPMQKRRRVTRACDECRRKKIKCDGKQPCTHCTVYSYDCTFDQPSNRRRNPVPAYVEALEARVHLAEGLIRMIAPSLDLNDPALEIAVRHGYIPGLKPSAQNAAQDAKTPLTGQSGPQKTAQKHGNKTETDLESMIQAVGQIDLDENGNWDYRGHSSGLSFIKRMREHLGDLMGPDTGPTPFIKTRKTSQITNSPRSASIESPMDSSGTMSDLPPEQVARELCGYAVNKQSVLLRVVHAPSFWKSFQRIYTTPPDRFTNEDHKFTILFYSALALGTVYGPQESSTYDSVVDKGFQYFRTARQMMDMVDIRDLTSIQAVTFMIMFLQTSSRLTQCYSYIGVALRAAIRMGLHRSFPEKRFNPLEAELRKRVFWSLRKLDIYTGAILGLPSNLGEDEIDQDYPAEIDDEYLSEDGLKTVPSGTISMMTAFNHHTRLVIILTKIVKTIYPICLPNGSQNKSYTVPFSKIKEIEQDLESWKDSLPQAFDPSNVASGIPNMLRAQSSLRVTYAFNQVLLYRPFLHFVEADKREKQTDKRAYACAASYIHVCRNLIHLCEARQREGMLTGSLWFIMYTTFFAVLSLVYFAAENPDNPTTQELIRDALAGRKILVDTAKVNVSADRCSATLDVIFNRLPEWMREGKQNPMPQRKRKQPQGNRQNHADAQAPTGQHGAASNLAPLEIVRGPTPTVYSTSERGYNPSGFSASPFTSTEDSPSTQTLQQFGLSAGSGNQDSLDLSSIIFSSAEPFTYPSQPLTTFENVQNFRDPMLYGTNGVANTQHMAHAAVGSNRPNTDGLQAQLYGFPPFVMQGNQWSAEPQAMRSHAVNSTGPLQSQPYIAAQMAEWPNQQNSAFNDQGFSDINLNEIFGGPEWSGTIDNQGFGQ